MSTGATANAFTVRALSARNAADFRTIRLEALKTSPASFGAAYEDNAERPLADFAARLGPFPNLVFGAFAVETLVGIAGFVVESGLHERHKGFMWGVYVQAPHRRNGIGEMLVKRVLDHARGHVEIVRSGVVATNAGAADLYLRLGFKIYGKEYRALKIDDDYFDEQLIAIAL